MIGGWLYMCNNVVIISGRSMWYIGTPILTTTKNKIACHKILFNLPRKGREQGRKLPHFGSKNCTRINFYIQTNKIWPLTKILLMLYSLFSYPRVSDEALREEKKRNQLINMTQTFKTWRQIFWLQILLIMSW